MQRTRITLLILSQAVLCLLETYLISKISFIGRVGIATIHKEYKLLRSGWKTFLLLFGIQIAIIITLNIIQKKVSRKSMILTASLLLGVAAIGFFITFQDFLHTYTHRLLKERFHLGFYLFWMGWMGSCIFFLANSREIKEKDTKPFPLDSHIPALAQPSPSDPGIPSI